MKVEDQDGINATLSAAQRRLVRGSFGEYAHFLAVVAHVRLALAGTER